MYDKISSEIVVHYFFPDTKTFSAYININNRNSNNKIQHFSTAIKNLHFALGEHARNSSLHCEVMRKECG